jgi:pyruvate/2-oxoglutarate dehydrogenase complex dihydrolipoamide dehydrogenase (E3) component
VSRADPGSAFDIVVIGAGASGEAAAHYAAKRGARVAVIDRDLFGGSCPFWACMPSKALLHAAAVRAGGGDFSWTRASDFRDWIINRVGIDYPEDRSHVESLEKAGAVVFRGEARILGRGAVEVRHDGRVHSLATRDIIVAVGSRSKVPTVEGLAEARPWTNVEATSLRELPRSVVVLGAGPSGVEFAQMYARFGVRTTIVQSNVRLNPTDHPKSSAYLAEVLRADGVDVRTGARATHVRAGAGRQGAHVLDLSDGGTVEGQVIVMGIGRAAPLRGLGLEALGVRVDGKDHLETDEGLRVAEGVYAVGDAIGREISTHLGHYEGEIAARRALGDEVRADFRAVPRCLYTDPEFAAVGLRVEQAQERGHDAIEESEDLATTAKGYVSESRGHVTIVVDRRERVLLGAFIAGPGAAEAIHEAVLAIRARIPLSVLADTIHAFPTTARVLGGLLAKVDFDLSHGAFSRR